MELQQHIQRKEEDCVKREDESKGGIKRGKGGEVETWSQARYGEERKIGEERNG